MTKLVFASLVLGLGLVVGTLTGCTTPIPEASKVWVVKPAGTLQCGAASINSARFAAELERAGVTPLQSGCADDGRMRAQACGLADGRLVAFQVVEGDVAAVRRYGFVPMPQMPSARRVPC